ncbi:putative toxin-antitoxin system toxin component, PIN family [Halarsenatibacter silvermanii]|nr:putative toxin-antitoxin system toxin component, PIN family [Halarsenatibacter silvermanii]
MVDTNILISAVLSSDSVPAELVNTVLFKHKLVLCDQIEKEMHRVFDEKFPDKKDDMEEFLTQLSYESVYTPRKINKEKYPDIRDEKDLPILVSAINADVDCFITGDKDFFALDLERPKIISARNFLEREDM